MIEVYYPQGMQWNKKTETHSAIPRIYDIFRTISDKKIIAIFATPREADDESTSLIEIFCRGKQVKYTSREIPYNLSPSFGKAVRLNLLEINLPARTIDRESNIPIEFRQGSFSYQTQVRPNLFFSLKKSVGMALVTVQKNTHIRQIKDWCLYYHRVHQVPYIVIYDNGSDNLDELAQGLHNLSPKLEIRIVSWDFPFLTANCRVAKTAALNHCYQILRNQTFYYLNFDVDEFLVNPSNKPLFGYLNDKTRASTLNLMITGKWMPTVYADGAHVKTAAQNRVFHFPYRSTNHYGNSCPKNIYRYEKRLKISIGFHGNILPSGRRKIEAYFIERTKQLLKLFLLRIVKVKRKPFLYDRYYKKYIDNELYFNHYEGLTNPWTVSRRERLIPKKYDPMLHEYDEEMAAALKIANLSED